MSLSSFGTADTAKAILVLTAFASSSPTVSAAPRIPEQQVRPAAVVPTSRSLVAAGNYQAKTIIAKNDSYDNVTRSTTPQEALIGELRSLRLLDSNWDGEGATAPLHQSIKTAESFVRLLGDITLPEPMLLASGHTSLYWNENGLYADIEFLGDGRVAYFIKNHGDKHKGVISFDSQKMPAVFQALLKA